MAAVAGVFSRELSVLLPSKSAPGVVIFVTLFFFIGLSNRAGMLPYVFTSSRHLAVRLSLALPLWLGCFLQNWLLTPKGALAHLVPPGTPAGLMPFIVVIERTSNLIRPGTLAVRLAANMIAGHLLLALIRGAVDPRRVCAGAGVLRAQCGLVLLEAAVALIQAYVFITLRALYVREV